MFSGLVAAPAREEAHRENIFSQMLRESVGHKRKQRKILAVFDLCNQGTKSEKNPPSPVEVIAVRQRKRKIPL
jgi:hypothetical protein